MKLMNKLQQSNIESAGNSFPTSPTRKSLKFKMKQFNGSPQKMKANMGEVETPEVINIEDDSNPIIQIDFDLDEDYSFKHVVQIELFQHTMPELVKKIQAFIEGIQI